MKNKIQAIAMIAFSGSIPTGIAYEPTPKPRPSKEHIEQVYIRANKVDKIAAKE